jgi:hypothetical protein
MIWEWLANMLGVVALAIPGVLGGTVLGRDGAPAGHALVVVRGQNVTLSATTDTGGRFAFSTLPHGEYDLLASKGDLRAAARVEVTAGGAEVVLKLAPLGTIHQAVVTHTSVPPVRGSGTDLTLNASMLSNLPASTSFPSLLAQLPGAARGANGVVHINGDHGDINYVVDGVTIPQALNREVGSEFDVANAAYVDVLEGAYPAQYGGRFAAVINIGTRAGTGVAGFSGYAEGGSFGTLDSSIEYHEPVGRGGLIFALHGGNTNYALDPPNPVSVHDQGSDANQFLRFTMPMAGEDYLNFTLSHSLQTFQIPNDLGGGQPASTDDNEVQNDTFAALQYRHAIGERGVLSFGPSYKRSNIVDFGDPQNDLAYGAFSFTGNSLANDAAFNADYDLRSKSHEFRMGFNYDITLVPKTYAFTLQTRSVVDSAPNVGHTESAYVQDGWQMGPNYELDYGLRMDAFTLFSTQFDDGFSQLSPRLKFARFFGKRASVYAYYGRFFTPFSFQNVSPYAAYLLNLPLQKSPAAFDLKPQRDSVYEIGGHLPIGSGDLGLRVMQKNATDLIDDTQVGITAFHQDINYRLGRIATQSAYYQLALPRNWRFYASVNHTYSVNKGCETQLLAPCFGSPVDWTPADHMQQWGATSGAVLNDAHGGWFSIDGEYGTGLSSVACAPTLQTLQCAYTPHIVLDAEKGIALGHNVALSLRVGNLLNDRYYVTFENAQGNHYAQARTVSIGFRFVSP